MRTLGAGPNDFHDRIRVLMSVGVRVGSAVGMVVVEAASGSAALSAVAAVVFLVGAMIRLSRWCRPVLSLKSCPTLHPLQGEYLASEAPLSEEYPDERADPRI